MDSESGSRSDEHAPKHRGRGRGGYDGHRDHDGRGRARGGSRGRGRWNANRGRGTAFRSRGSVVNRGRGYKSWGLEETESYDDRGWDKGRGREGNEERDWKDDRPTREHQKWSSRGNRQHERRSPHRYNDRPPQRHWKESSRSPSRSHSRSRSRSKSPDHARYQDNRSRDRGEKPEQDSSVSRDPRKKLRPSARSKSPTSTGGDGEKSIRVTIGNDKYKAEPRGPPSAEGQRKSDTGLVMEHIAVEASKVLPAKRGEGNIEVRNSPVKDPTKKSFLELFLDSDSLTNFASKLQAESQGDTGGQKSGGAAGSSRAVEERDFEAKISRFLQQTGHSTIGGNKQPLVEQIELPSESQQSYVEEKAQQVRGGYSSTPREQSLENRAALNPRDPRLNRAESINQRDPRLNRGEERVQSDARLTRNEERAPREPVFGRFHERGPERRRTHEQENDTSLDLGNPQSANTSRENMDVSGRSPASSLRSGVSGAEKDFVLPVKGIPGLEKLKNTDDEDAFLYGDVSASTEPAVKTPKVSQGVDVDYSSRLMPKNDADSLIRGRQESVDHRLATGANPPAPAPQGNEREQSQNTLEEAPPTEVLKNILQSIGFDFKYQKKVQEMAQKKRELSESSTKPDSYGIKPGTSFMDGGLSKVDIGDVFNTPAEKTMMKEEKKPPKVLDNTESYQERARRYLEEQRSLSYESTSQEQVQSYDQYGRSGIADASAQMQYDQYGQQEGLYYNRYGQQAGYSSDVADYEMRQYMEVQGQQYDQVPSSYFASSSSLTVIQPQPDEDVAHEGETEYHQPPSNWRSVEDTSMKKPTLLEILGVKQRAPSPRKTQPEEVPQQDIDERDQQRQYLEQRYSNDGRRPGADDRRYESQGYSDRNYTSRQRNDSASPPSKTRRKDRSFSPEEKRKYRDEQRYSPHPQVRRSRRESRSPPDHYGRPQKRSLTPKGNEFPPPQQQQHRKYEKDSVPQQRYSAPSKEGFPPRDRKPHAAIPKRELTMEEQQLLLNDMESRRDLLFELEKQLHFLRSQQNEMMRRKQRQQDGHRDPELLQNMRQQEGLMEEITRLRTTVTQECLDEGRDSKFQGMKRGAPRPEEINRGPQQDEKYRGLPEQKPKKRGVSPPTMKKPKQYSSSSSSASSSEEDSSPRRVETERRTISIRENKTREPASRDEAVVERRSIQIKSRQSDEKPEEKKTIRSTDRGREDDRKTIRGSGKKEEEKPGSRKQSASSEQGSKSKKKQEDPIHSAKKFDFKFEYYDAGHYFCRHCNHVSATIFDVFTHVLSENHLSMLEGSQKPWRKDYKEPKPETGMKTVMAPIKGVEFLVGVPQAYYCMVCSKFSADQEIALDHLKSEIHSDNYRKYIDDNPQHERLQTLGRQAALSVRQDIAKREEAAGRRKSASMSLKREEIKEHHKESEKSDSDRKHRGKDARRRDHRSSESSRSSSSGSRTTSRSRSKSPRTSSKKPGYDTKRRDIPQRSQKVQSDSRERLDSSTKRTASAPRQVSEETGSDRRGPQNWQVQEPDSKSAYIKQAEEDVKAQVKAEAEKIAKLVKAQEEDGKTDVKKIEGKNENKDSSPEIDRISALLSKNTEKPGVRMDIRAGVKKPTAPSQTSPQHQALNRSAIKFPFIGKKPFLKKKPGSKRDDDKAEEKKDDSQAGAFINIKLTTKNVDEVPKPVLPPPTIKEEPEIIVREQPTKPVPVAAPETKYVAENRRPGHLLPSGDLKTVHLRAAVPALDSIPMPAEPSSFDSKKLKDKSRDHFRKRTEEDLEMLGLDPSDSAVGKPKNLKTPPPPIQGPKRGPQVSQDIFPGAGGLGSLKKAVEKKAACDDLKTIQRKKKSDEMAEFEVLDECH